MSFERTTPCGVISGTACQWPGIAAYKGIRYATAGRWEFPVPVTHWDGVYDATQYGACCYQPRAFYDEAAAPKAPAEEGAEEIPDVAHVKAAEATGSASPAGAEVGVDARKAKLVVLGPLVLVGQHFIGFVDFFKAGLRLFVPRVQVGVVLLGQLSVCFFQLVGRGVLLHAQDLVVVSFLFCHILHL